MITNVAGIPVSTNEPVLALQSLSVDKLPEWPSDFSDGKRFYVVRLTRHNISFVLFTINYKQ